jgi:hypothetical protein
MRMRFIFPSVFLALGLALPVPLAAQSSSAGSNTTPRRLRTLPNKVSLEELRQHVIKEDKGIYSKGDAVDLILNHSGVAFECTAEIREELRSLKASDAVLRASGCPYPVPAPPDKPKLNPSPAGPITITCVPEDCEVVVLGHTIATGDQGVKTIPTLPAGETIFEIRRAGFQSTQITALLKERKSESFSITLAPLESSRRQWAIQALMKAVSSIGGFMGTAELFPLSAQGTVALSDDKGENRKYVVTARLWSPKAWSYSAVLNGKECSIGIPQTRKKKTQPCDSNLQEALKTWGEYHFPFVVERALSNSDSLSAERERADSSGFAANVETIRETTRIRLSETYSPVSVSIRGHRAGDVPVEVEYGDFAGVGGARYPRKVTIVKGGQKLRFEFSELKPVAPGSPLN